MDSIPFEQRRFCCRLSKRQLSIFRVLFDRLSVDCRRRLYCLNSRVLGDVRQLNPGREHHLKSPFRIHHPKNQVLVHWNPMNESIIQQIFDFK